MKKAFLLTSILIVFSIMSHGMYRPDAGTIRITMKHDSIVGHSAELDKFYSTKTMGVSFADNQTIFRLFAPQALKVTLHLYKKAEDILSEEFNLTKDEDGVWEISLWGEKAGLYYGYKVFHTPDDAADALPLCLDPYAKAVASYNTYLSPRKGIILREDFYDWGKDANVNIDWRDVIVYEAHVRDMTADKSSGAKLPGTYQGLISKSAKGGLNYITSLGVNAVELLPSMEFANIELPYQKENKLKRIVNTWNPYERNHWGYMTAAFFAPAAYYAEESKELKWNTWQGKSGKQITAFKDMVKAFHKNKIAVIMDVVFNHLSEYELGNLKEIDKEYYFRLDDRGGMMNESYCGNDLKTERPMTRKLIVESILYWMKEYHVDGFRFDLGKMLDWKTIEDIIAEAKKVNPHVIIVCEPWGGGYDPMGFSARGWGAWNDQIRNGVKGENPDNGLGWIFGHWYGNNSIERVKSYVRGTLVRDQFGLFQKPEHSVNYLESHDGYTLGDFIRIGSKEVDPANVIKDIKEHSKLSPYQMKLNKLGALFLFTSQGMTMISSGQEFARSKVIPLNGPEGDANKGHIDHNTYDKDNTANYINYDIAEQNKELIEYYKGLIKLRNIFPAFRRAAYDDIVFLDIKDAPFALAYTVKYEKETFLVLMNADQKLKHEFILPEGKWSTVVTPKTAGIEKIKACSKSLSVEPVSGYVLRLSK